MSSKIKDLSSNAEIRSKAEDFLCAAERVFVERDPTSTEIQGYGYRRTKVGSYIYDEELLQSLQNFVLCFTDKLGAHFGNEEQIRKLSWEYADTFKFSSENFDKSAVTQFLKNVITSLSKDILTVFPCRSIQFDQGIEKIDVGAVSVATGTEILREFNHNIAEEEFISIFDIPDSDGFSSSLNWLVKNNVSQGNADEEAIWLVDIAMTLIRFAKITAEGPRAYGWFPRIGDTESHPIDERNSSRESIHITREEYGYHTSSSLSVHHIYSIGNRTKSYLESGIFVSICKNVFGPDRESVGARLARSLAFLSRARRSEDKAERLIYLATSVEALVSSKSGGEGVVDKVARRLSVLLSDVPRARYKITKDVKELYELRSSLVHRGERKAIKTKINHLENLAEGAAYQIFKYADLTEPYETYGKALDEAAFGTPWIRREPQSSV